MNEMITTLAPSASLDEASIGGFADALAVVRDLPLFADQEEWDLEGTPFRRTLRPQTFAHVDFATPLGAHEPTTYKSLVANRILQTAYEAEFVLLPRTPDAHFAADFALFYAPRTQAALDIVRRRLEETVFSFLDDEIDLSGRWRRSDAKAYLEAYVTQEETAQGNAAMAAIEASPDPRHAAKTFLIQLASDFLLESSPMARTTIGNYGPIQSEIFKVLIDEYGYGVHSAKHSTLYEETLSSVGLSPAAHTHWQFYLSGSLMMNNYFNYVCRNPRHFFRYLGALFQAETGFIRATREWSQGLGRVFGDEIALGYFAEHAHIDMHHSRMALENVVLPAIDAFGEGVIPDILRGFEEAKLLAELAERDFCAQVGWMDAAAPCKRLAPGILANIEARPAAERPPLAPIDEPRGELSVMHVHDGDELCWIREGVMHFWIGHDRYTRLEAGEGTVIRAQRLHGAIIDSERCLYEIHSIGDHRAWL
ncbi:iron-containing redox enzyme family protein [Salinarimonas chemoclinalis]|uniref:iron-containing redox enzyme family protein n=1 Tax=Salinarimonas chemoclinalis TaxID=3241599 RepID=UPI003556ED64